ncbi:DMT family transporter [Permianibacter aggregans]|uniref:EamA domain-containing membrane protein RarD n=1 Tax=Permianibacter aggregans TaxID=1510150 RepID=A0A4R6UNI9_9GAMM|nr:DMT family transporter [Permianibacter aggregans]QGX38997.1 DMT family transporter [Permianibacter aggregans]TDQ46755.1 EamA domain-containing membrane protein RarD [Permianibacter aggregans]
MHQVSGQWQRGLLLSLTTALLWGVLPLALKALLTEMNAISISWFRFLSAALLLFFWLRSRRQLPARRALQGSGWKLLLICVAGLVGNYLFYLWSIDKISAAGAQVLIQLAPLFLLLGSVWIFKEAFAPGQWAGLAVFTTGLVLFFNQRLADLAANPEFLPGALLMLIASITWAAYALAQKSLLRKMNSPAIMMLIYIAAAVLLLPGVEMQSAASLSVAGILLLIFACLNTLLAYGAFAEALAHWEASRVSATLAVTPLVTIFSSELLAFFWPGSVVLEPLNAWSYLGALMVVLGSMAAALLRR